MVLLTLHTDINNLKDVVIGAEFQRSNVDLDIVFQKVLCQLSNLFWPGGTPHQSLSVGLAKETPDKPKLAITDTKNELSKQEFLTLIFY